MKKNLLIIFGVSVFSINFASANEIAISGLKLPPPTKQIYKYQDNNGKWVYGDTAQYLGKEVQVLNVKKDSLAYEKVSSTTQTLENMQSSQDEKQKKLDAIDAKLKKDKEIEQEIKEVDRKIDELKEKLKQRDPETNHEAYEFIGKTRILSEKFVEENNKLKDELSKLEAQKSYLKGKLSY